MCRKVCADMAAITLERLSKVYGDGTEAVRGLDLEIGDGEFVVLVGPSGCGKTTALRMVAGLEEITSGEVRVGERVVNDQPPSNLDAKLRVEMRAEITRIQRDLKVTTMYVTHDQTEAMTLGDRVAVLNRGVLQQLASPQVLYDAPVNLFVAEFIGSPAMNVAEAELTRENGEVVVRFAEDQRLTVPPAVLEARPALASFVGKKVVLGIRPEDIEDAEFADGPLEGATITATLDIREDMGSEVYAHFPMNAPPPQLEAVKEALGRELVE